MSQSGSLKGSGGGSSGITTINGDSGSITGSTVTIYANKTANNCGSSVSFVNSGTVSTLNVSDANQNTVIGLGAGAAGISGTNNTGLGTANLFNLSSGSNNTAIGDNSLSFLLSGSYNTAIGLSSGTNYSGAESSNVCVNNAGSGGESNTIRIGQQGSGTGQQNKCFIAGITGVTVTGSAVLCSVAGALGTISSSLRYKENVKSMDESVSILHLTPVEFNFKTDETKTKNYGLIAEEVNEKFPYLCLYNDEGQPESVKYHEMVTFLLKEVQKLHKRIAKLEG